MHRCAVDDIPFEHPGGEIKWFDNRAVKVGDGLSFTWRDVTDRYRARDTLQDLAHHDPLTGLANRLDLHERLPARLARAHPGSALAVLFCDVDEFKHVNDRYGHDVGDEVLLEIARRMTATVRSNDYIARLGGDEFVVLLDRVRDIQQAASVADKIREAILEPMPLGAGTGQVTLSIGIALALGGEDSQPVLTAADRALYRAKEAGRNHVHRLRDTDRHDTRLAVGGIGVAPATRARHRRRQSRDAPYDRMRACHRPRFTAQCLAREILPRPHSAITELDLWPECRCVVGRPRMPSFPTDQSSFPRSVTRRRLRGAPW